eukprot:CAMPEP_0171102240 /NCGR_PEP_ID=MMETSP0766_2-20121228/57245_1 /TAXON_ID=439317 /ORGANISM="Gambierdiscus australes, Strain CAWD 149" /LENGTH=357 /DNA_ID=CAMNT_0011562479 /DNA_START=44 /DNA_END=1117 /DNA_ORIENTATION=+
MKSNVATVAVLALLLSAFPSLATRAGEAYATRWLREHPAAEVDELAELKSQNPSAYAIVKALLTKRSLGLLNPKHPSASFRAAPAQSEDSAASGPAAFQALASPASGANAMYAEAPVAQPHRDWLHWKPATSATDDEAMVNSVLGAVAGLKGGRSHPQGEVDDIKATVHDSASEEVVPAQPQLAAKSLVGSAPLPDSGSPKEVAADEDSGSTKQVDVSAGEKASAPAAPENPYLKGLDLGVSTPAAARPTNRENSYLKSVDLGTPAAKSHVQEDDSTDYLASFSWDDKPKSKAAPAKKHEVTSAHSAERPAAQHKNALLSWLGGSSAQEDDTHEHAKKPEQPAASTEHQNAYLAYLQ